MCSLSWVSVLNDDLWLGHICLKSVSQALVQSLDSSRCFWWCICLSAGIRLFFGSYNHWVAPGCSFVGQICWKHNYFTYVVYAAVTYFDIIVFEDCVELVV